uniref:Spiroplasma plectrovirus-related protein n=1 Tax=Parastrongyloides trichosuri TaxID=131310 RepID=A0A0N5A2C2_PARTI
MKKSLLTLILFFQCFQNTFSLKGFDSSQLLSKNLFNCIFKEGYYLFIGRVYKSTQFIDQDGFQNIKNARYIGFKKN